MIDFIARRPWIWIALLLGTLVLTNLVFVWICVTHPIAPATAP